MLHQVPTTITFNLKIKTKVHVCLKKNVRSKHFLNIFNLAQP